MSELPIGHPQTNPVHQEAMKNMRKQGELPIPAGELIGKGDGPLGHADDRRMWEASPDESGPRIYAARGYVVVIQWGVERGTVQVDPGRAFWEPFMAAMQAARRYANRRYPGSRWLPVEQEAER